MRLTIFTDYTLRSLLYLGMNRDRLITIQEIADLHSISKSHLTKVIFHLGQIGLAETVRGRNGGLRLGLEPEKINIGKVVRATENDFFMAECFGVDHSSCAHFGACRLTHVLHDATNAYLAILDEVTLADLLRGTRRAKKNLPESQPVSMPKSLKGKT